MDVYVSPHSDDICFSLGALAHNRRSGILLTVFPISSYVARSGAPRLSPAEVTRTRTSEDLAFASACGLRAHFMDAKDALLLGHRPFDLTWADANATRIEPALTQALLEFGSQNQPGMRPWLFCPSGIGGHVDHVAVRSVVTRHFERLARLYRLAFYEDLHYASDPVKRGVGLFRLFEALSSRALRRHSWLLGNSIDVKLALIRMYPSQFIEMPESIERFTPSMETGEAPTAPHEAIWTEEMVGPRPRLMPLNS